MNTLDSVIKGFDSSINTVMDKVDHNEYVSTALSLFLILYAAVAAPRLPKYVVKLFDNIFVKLLLFFLIAYIARRNPTVAILSAIAVMVTLLTLNKISVNDKLVHMAKMDARQEAMQNVPSAIHSGIPMPNINNQMMGEHKIIPDHISMEEASVRNMVNIPEEALSEIRPHVPAEVKQEVSGELGAPVSAGLGMQTTPFVNTGCVRVANYRDSFYPQYVNMKPDAYLQRYTGSDVGGYDVNSRYGGRDGRRSYSGDRNYDDDRGSYS